MVRKGSPGRHLGGSFERADAETAADSLFTHPNGAVAQK